MSILGSESEQCLSVLATDWSQNALILEEVGKFSASVLYTVRDSRAKENGHEETSPHRYYARPTEPSVKERDLDLRDAVEQLILDFPGYGHRRVTAALR